MEYQHHYANHTLVNDEGEEFTVKTYLLNDGSMFQVASTGLTRTRPVPTEKKPDPQYGSWRDPLLDKK